jgi:hypothetical protein
MEGPIGAEISRTVYKNVDSRRLTDSTSKSLGNLMGVRLTPRLGSLGLGCLVVSQPTLE